MYNSKLARRAGTFAVWLVIVAACSKVSYDSSYDPAIDFGAYETYAWREAGEEVQRGGPALSESAESHIKAAVDERLQTKGYRRVTSERPDFRVNFAAVVEEVVGDDAYGAGVQPRWPGATRVESREWRVGTLVIDVFDGGTQELVWRGTAEGAVDPDVSDEERSERAIAAVGEILSRFPPRRD